MSHKSILRLHERIRRHLLGYSQCDSSILLRRELTIQDLKSRIEWSCAFNQMHFRVSSVRSIMYAWRRCLQLETTRCSKNQDRLVYGMFCTAAQHVSNCKCVPMPQRYWYSNTLRDNQSAWTCALTLRMNTTGLLNCLLVIVADYLIV